MRGVQAEREHDQALPQRLPAVPARNLSEAGRERWLRQGQVEPRHSAAFQRRGQVVHRARGRRGRYPRPPGRGRAQPALAGCSPRPARSCRASAENGKPSRVAAAATAKEQIDADIQLAAVKPIRWFSLAHAETHQVT